MPRHWLTIHGSYPQDFGYYKTIKDLTREEAVRIARKDARAQEADESGEELWLNKGFILLDHIGMHLDRSLTRNAVKPGIRALYNHDGNYRLIEWEGTSKKSSG